MYSTHVSANIFNLYRLFHTGPLLPHPHFTPNLLTVQWQSRRLAPMIAKHTLSSTLGCIYMDYKSQELTLCDQETLHCPPVKKPMMASLTVCNTSQVC